MDCLNANHDAAVLRSNFPSAKAAAPSGNLLRAALAGLIAVGLAGCDEEHQDSHWECEPSDAGKPPTAAPADAGSAPAVADAGNTPGPVDAGAPVVADAGSPVVDAGAVPVPADAGPQNVGDAGPVGPITTKETVGDRPFASLKADCAQQGGYLQVHAACAGANNCKGFSYGDFMPGVLTEHTCASANGCTGVSCVVSPKDSGKTGKEVYELEDLPVGGPASCLNCHAIWSGKDAAGNYLPPDKSKFKVWVMPGSTRTVANWLELSAEAQEAVVAFGRTGVMPDGTAQVSMRGYHQVFSRAEMQRVVQHIRTLTPVMAEIKSPL